MPTRGISSQSAVTGSHVSTVTREGSSKSERRVSAFSADDAFVKHEIRLQLWSAITPQGPCADRLAVCVKSEPGRNPASGKLRSHSPELSFPRGRVTKDSFQLQEFVQPGLTPFSAVARLFVASKTTPEV